MTKSMTTGGGKHGKKKGPLWDLYSHIVEGRILVKPDGTKGVVCCFKYHDYSLKFAAVYQVRWENSRTSVDVPAHLVEQWCTDVFANESWVPKKIRAAQLANWYGDKADAFMDSPLLKVYCRNHAELSDAPPAGPPNKKAKTHAHVVQHGIFVSPPKAGKPCAMAAELHQATHTHMTTATATTASRRNCRSVHHSPAAAQQGHGQEGATGEGQGQGQVGEGGLFGHIRNVCSRLVGAGGGGEADAGGSRGESPPAAPTSAAKHLPAQVGGKPTKSATATAAAMHMGAATLLAAQQGRHKVGKQPGGKAAAFSGGGSKAWPSTASGATLGKAGPKGSKGKQGSAAKQAEEEEEEEWVPSWTGKVYPRSVCFRPGDKLVQDMTMDDLVGEFKVEHIVDEFVTKRSRWFLIKYKGYELRLGNGENDKGDWELLRNVKGTKAYEEWQRKKPAYFYQITSGRAEPEKMGRKVK